MMEEHECEEDSEDSVDRQKVSVAPDSDQVDHSALSTIPRLLAHSMVIQIPQYVEVEAW